MTRAGLALSIAGVGLAVAMLSHLHWRPATRAFEWSYPQARGGDEPHYLVIVNSLLSDGDFDVKDEYADALAGGPSAGDRARGRPLLHHTYVKDPRSGRTVPWQRVYRFWERPPCGPDGCAPFEPNRIHGFPDLDATIEIPAHPPAFSVVLAGLLAPFSPRPPEVERDVAVALTAFAVATLFVAAGAARRAGLTRRETWAAVGLLAFASPWLVYTRSFFTEGLNALVLAAALWAALDRRWIVAGVCVGLAFAIKPIFVLVGVAWLLDRALERDARGFVRLAATLGGMGCALLLASAVAVGRARIDGGYPWLWPDGLQSAYGTLFDARHGLLWWTPWLVLLALPAVQRLRERGTDRQARAPWRLLALPPLFHFALLSSYGRIAGACVGPRYWIPFLPWLAIAALLAVRGSGRGGRIALGVLAAVAALAAVPATLGYDHLFREPPALGLELMLGLR